MPVHSEFRQPRISSSSASSSSFCAFTRPPELLLQRIAVDSVVVSSELVDEVLDLVQRVAGRDPEGGRLASAAVLLPRVRLGELLVGSLDRAGVCERLSLALL